MAIITTKEVEIYLKTDKTLSLCWKHRRFHKISIAGDVWSGNFNVVLTNALRRRLLLSIWKMVAGLGWNGIVAFHISYPIQFSVDSTFIECTGMSSRSAKKACNVLRHWIWKNCCWFWVYWDWAYSNSKSYPVLCKLYFYEYTCMSLASAVREANVIRHWIRKMVAGFGCTEFALIHKSYPVLCKLYFYECIWMSLASAIQGG